jgi:hypothetical protein
MNTPIEGEVPPTPETLMRIHARMREKLITLTDSVTDLEAKMKTVKGALLDHFKLNGLDSIRTPYGIAYRTVRTTYSTADWENFYKFVLDHNAPYLLEKRLHQSNTQAFLADNPELLPPGLNSSSEYTITIRRK